jgi:tRNA (guanine37-N1)-methyltransferase
MDGLLEHPHYTRPAVYQGLAVPEILLSGNHGAIERWRREESLRHTLKKRPDLLPKVELSKEDQKALAKIKAELKS